MAVDVTSERATLDALARSEAKLRQALRIGGLGHFERDFVARVTEYSDELMAIHGLPETRRRETVRAMVRARPSRRPRPRRRLRRGAASTRTRRWRSNIASRGRTGRCAASPNAARCKRDAAGRLHRLHRPAARRHQRPRRRTGVARQRGAAAADAGDGSGRRIRLGPRQRRAELGRAGARHLGSAGRSADSIGDFYRGLHPDDVAERRERPSPPRTTPDGRRRLSTRNIASSTRATAACAMSRRAAARCSKTAGPCA